MPYVNQSSRERLSASTASINNPGELNYLFTELIKKYLSDKTLNYQLLNDVTGALENCKMEFYRRIVVNFENGKIEKNGDVYG